MPRVSASRRHGRLAARGPLSVFQILAWADAHRERTGHWPQVYSGPVLDGPRGEKWRNVDNALRYGLRGLPGHSSLAQLLAEWRGLRNTQDLASLTEGQILEWAEAHHRRTGSWPNADSGPIPECPGELWSSVNAALRDGGRGLGGASSLARLLAGRLGVRNRASIPQLTTAAILAWADAHFRRTGTWPRRRSGPVKDAPSETWHAVELALNRGMRGLPGGSSLAQLLAEHRGVRNRAAIPLLTIPLILKWARLHYQRLGVWPIYRSGLVLDAPGEMWQSIDTALRKGRRGLPGGSSLARLLARCQEGAPDHAPEQDELTHRGAGAVGRHSRRRLA
jgi:hypothetical protein